MSYDPFARGEHPVGVRSVDLKDPARDRLLPLELWYPAAEEHRGQDLSDETRDHYKWMAAAPEATQDAVRDAAPRGPRNGRFPLVVFSHGWGGHRRQTTHFCIHLASHGYVVASPDHTGNTMVDTMELFMKVQAGGALPDAQELMGGFIANRPADASFVIDQAFAGGLGAGAESIDADAIGMTGHSFGGWTTLTTTGRDPRIRAALPLAPAGGETPLIRDLNPLADALDLDWKRDVPTLYLVAEFDNLLPLEGMHDLVKRTRGPAKMVVLLNSDHMHFCDRVEETHEMFRVMGGMISGGMEGAPDFGSILEKLKPASELCPGEAAYAFLQGLGLAHMDAHLRGNGEAAAILEGDVEALLRERSVAVKVA
ncbi:MAG: dienelactone hydrolase family protein [Proteobacteria bacterium]|nr:dienelactone hydrolase family protein [Pseudomonadota bacterium]